MKSQATASTSGIGQGCWPGGTGFTSDKGARIAEGRHQRFVCAIRKTYGPLPEIRTPEKDSAKCPKERSKARPNSKTVGSLYVGQTVGKGLKRNDLFKNRRGETRTGKGVIRSPTKGKVPREGGSTRRWNCSAQRGAPAEWAVPGKVDNQRPRQPRWKENPPPSHRNSLKEG